jgi:hypothetical protein
MTAHRLGKAQDAQGYLLWLRELMKFRHWAKDKEAADFLREAEELLQPKTAPAKAAGHK